ncbi:thymidylate synthase [Bacillus safensis]|uniref:thymidylate synthase n=1 Tax=Bacillus safensis TaxID=561879 RepID=UPI0022826DA5|nr:thymidylate synthase [Bacillus safensis]MCY7542402.1 thymidylate synthase [Bacillus safensis]MCY7552265.1 thymidylate synthase [Bacillus safensis]MCY7644708.1 thymidylate synthase [Bacillus safensis]MCY7655977.1 thymidylate synthase [Bacillus safensis]MEC3710452.1 thymidylate synthase [Bacillus safensis]
MEKEYLKLLQKIYAYGHNTGDRTETGMRSLFGETMEFNLAEGFPLVTTKKMFTRGVFGELLWFLSGSTSNKELEEKFGIKFWKEWANEAGQLPNIYGKQWTRWEDGRGNIFNQIKYVIDQIKYNPTSRRILFTGWNAPEMQWEDTALPCCHSTVVQFYVEGDYLHMYHYQRSGDMFLGVPVNIASYATLLTMIAQQCDLKPGIMKHTVGVAHIYHNHLEQVKEQLTREPFHAPRLNIKRKPDSIFDYKLEDFEVVDYVHHLLIKGDVAI